MAAATDFFVDATATGAQTGADWMNAFHFLEDALAASVDGDNILLAEGTYLPGANTSSTLRTETFNITTRVRIYGGYLVFNGGTSVTPDQPDGNRFNTHLSGDIAGTPMSPGDDVYHVVTISGLGAVIREVRLDGLRVSNGFADGLGTDESIGAGILVKDSWLLMSDAFLRENFSTGNGAGVNVSGISKLQMKNTRLRRNLSDGDGAAIYAQDSTEAVLFNLQMSQNASQARGGALRFSTTTGGTLELVNSILFDNRANAGGAISMDAKTGGRDIINCTIAFNSLNSGGPAGAGIHVDSHNNTVQLLNSIVYKNPEFTNTDNVWTANPAQFFVDHSDLGTSVAGLNITAQNVNLDPDFRNETARNLKLKKTSPCLEAGSDGLLPPDDLDIDEDGPGEKLDRDIRVSVNGVPQERELLTASPVTLFGVDQVPLGRIVDMGAYEHLFPDETGGGGT